MRLDLRFIVPAPGGSTTILLDRLGRLPAIVIDGPDGDAAIVIVDRFLNDQWRFASAVLETHPRWADVSEGDPIPTLVSTEPAAADWTPLDGLSFGPIPVGLDGLPDSLVPRAGELLGELRAASPPPSSRPPWARRGWRDRTASWMTMAMAEIGRPLVEPPRPFFLRGISALMRGSTAGGDVFLKAVFPHFHAEPVATSLVAARFPDLVPVVLAVEADEGWLILEDLASPWVGDLPVETRVGGLVAGARALTTIQMGLAADLAPFVAAGCPRRPLATLADQLDAAIGPDGLGFPVALTGERRERATRATRNAIERVVALGLPDSLVHGDFHHHNVALVDGRAVIIDWSDAAVSNPAIDLVTWLTDWSPDDATGRAEALDAWAEGWAGIADPAELRAGLEPMLIVGAAYQIVSYEGILGALEPATRYTMSGGTAHFLEELERRIDAPGFSG